jgi:hypothetical protein
MLTVENHLAPVPDQQMRTRIRLRHALGVSRLGASDEHGQLRSACAAVNGLVAYREAKRNHRFDRLCWRSIDPMREVQEVVSARFQPRRNQSAAQSRCRKRHRPWFSQPDVL